MPTASFCHPTFSDGISSRGNGHNSYKDSTSKRTKASSGSPPALDVINGRGPNTRRKFPVTRLIPFSAALPSPLPTPIRRCHVVLSQSPFVKSTPPPSPGRADPSSLLARPANSPPLQRGSSNPKIALPSSSTFRPQLDESERQSSGRSTDYPTSAPSIYFVNLTLQAISNIDHASAKGLVSPFLH
ncbi:uncharacterized protein BKA78DRAFT_298074 [Phyllosticta capitalensis]|uniref:uncharacterized protein n=1 Tax=Phyllosticta capitalensis TaxID=121624 RepID=UPI00312F2577